VSTGSELHKIAKALDDASGECVLATLVEVTGSSYRRPGARMLITESGATTGAVSAGCLESELKEQAFAWTRNGSCAISFKVGSPEDELLGFGSGCNGTLRVLFERISARAPSEINRISRALKSRETSVLATVFDAKGSRAPSAGCRLAVNGMTDFHDSFCEAIEADALRTRTSGETRLFRYSCGDSEFSVLWEIVRPPVALTVFGSGENVGALLNGARTLGWETTLCDKRTELFNRQQGLASDRMLESVPGELPAELATDDCSAAVVMTHQFQDDLQIVASLLKSSIPYVGVLGGRKRNARLVDELKSQHPNLKFDKLFAPVGLDLGAETAEEISIAVLAEILAFMNKRDPSHLKSGTESLHAALKMEERRIVEREHISVAAS